MGLRFPKSGFTVPAPGVAHGVIGAVAPCVDKVRDLYAQLGARAYVVRLVWTRWSGGARGDGVESVVRTRDVLPVPKISSLDSVNASNSSVGTTEVGGISVSEISTCFTEDELTGRPLDDSENFYWEVEFVNSADRAPTKRRFTVNSAPAQDPLRFQWTIKLTRAMEDRSPNGEPRG